MNLIPGTVVQIDFGFYKHPGLVTDRILNAKPMVISNSLRKRGVYEESWEEFSQGKQVEIGGYPGSLSPGEVLERARSKIGSKWNVFIWNCEHFINWSHGLKTRSTQVRIYTTCTFAITGLALLVIKRRSRIAG